MNAVLSGTPDLVPLAVDVDGTLVRTDLLHEAALEHVARNPHRTAHLFGWLGGGKAGFKSRLADHAAPELDSVPLHEEVVDLIRAAQAEGRPVWLASASDHRYVAALAERIGGIAGVIATTPGQNMSGRTKAAALDAAFGAGGYDYAGNDTVDFPVWRRARRQYVVAASSRFERAVLREFPAAEVIARPRTGLAAWRRAIRPHQWAKNLLVFLPMIAGHDFTLRALVFALIAFVCFSAAASSAYIVNDLLDLAADRAHPTKRARPFASGELPVMHGALLSAALLFFAVDLSLLLPWRFALVLGGYVAATLAYSLVLKRKPLIDVIALGGLYTVRVIGGLVATGEKYSQWLMMFSLFLFLSLAVVKRCTELVMRREAGKGDVPGRGYTVADLAVLFPAAVASGYGAILVVALYMQSPEVLVLYRHYNRLWLLYPLLLYWISRIVLIASRNQLHDDPVVFALTDRTSWVVGALAAGVIAIAI
ncbi:UbiA family prenyltransferase [Novosphingobium flavum]|uniref:UbiA family prenyltransferase n=1 Tax=Novosphingobium flavum TaxID=1778672 RepID=A0A7X1FPH1_9SPHN|nr:UbiA family prenyltransferase [Novosphingobium flavum]MBC2664464.1 UbiA family prenyltransferase [Novosphingobium flavum]